MRRNADPAPNLVERRETTRRRLIALLMALAVLSGSLHAARPLDARAVGGLIATFAGNGADYAGGTSVTDGIGDPLAIAAGPDDSYFVAIADRVLRMLPDGTMSTYAGGGAGALVDGAQATAVALAPRRLATTANGTLYVSLADRVVRVAVDGTITTVATGLQQANGLAVDEAGVVYVADTPAHVVRRISPSGESDVVVGTEGLDWCFTASDGSWNCFASPVDVTLLPDGGLLAANSSTAVRRDSSTGRAFQWSSGAGGTAIHYADGIVYSVRSSNRVEQRTYPGATSGGHVAGSGSATFSGDGGRADRAGMVPRDVAVLDNSSLVIADGSSKRIRVVFRVPPSMPQLTIATAAGTGERGPGGDLVSGPNGGPATGTGAGAPADVAIGADGSVYFVDTVSWTVRKVATDGTISRVAGGGSGFTEGAQATSVDIRPEVIDVEDDGTMWLGNRTAVWRVTPGGVINRVLVDNATNGLRGLTGNGQGDVIVASSASPYGVIKATPGSAATDACPQCAHRERIAGQTSAPGYSGNGGPATAARLNGPTDVAFGPDGWLYVAEQTNGVIRRISPEGVIHHYAFAFESDGLSVAKFVEKLDAEQQGLPSPTSLAFDHDGALYVSSFQHTVVRIDPASGETTWVAGDGFGRPGWNGDGAAVDAQLDLRGPSGVVGPAGVAVSPDGTRLYIADAGNGRVRTVTGFPPPAPRNFTATAGDRDVLLKWSPSTRADVVGYRIYRAVGDGDPLPLPGGLRSTTTYLDGGLTNGTAYTYHATAVDSEGNESGPSNSQTVTPQPPQPPAPPPTAVLEGRSGLSSALPGNQQGILDAARAGDPVNLIFGNFTYEQTDLSVPGGRDPDPHRPDVQLRDAP
jgi:sugar lactone lactonase YvrE